MRLHKTFLIIAALALFIGACGADGPDEGALPTNPDTAAGAAGTCLAGDPNCQDTGAMPDLEGPGDDDAPMVATPIDGGGLTVASALISEGEGPLAVGAYYFDTPDGTFLCDAIAESFPPQCGGERIPLDNSAGVDLGPLETEGDVTWSAEPISVVGEVIDGVFVLTATSS